MLGHEGSIAVAFHDADGRVSPEPPIHLAAGHAAPLATEWMERSARRNRRPWPPSASADSLP
jgi:hypothetical protein